MKKIAVRSFDDPRFIEVEAGQAYRERVEDVLCDPEIDIVVELMGGVDPARAFITRAIEEGKHVVTANKALISTHGGELLDLAEARAWPSPSRPAWAGASPSCTP